VVTTPDLMLAVLDRLGTAPAWIARAHALGVRISEVQATADRVYLYCPTVAEAEQLGEHLGLRKTPTGAWYGDNIAVHVSLHKVGAA
jgi:hypothetical protein